MIRSVFWLFLLALSGLAACDPSIAPGQADPGTIGASCSDTTSCTQVSDAVCLKMGSDGYCAKDCSSFGQFGCPSGSICETMADQATYCLDGCCSDSDCRDNFRCASRPALQTYVDLGVCSSPGVCVARCRNDDSCEVGYRCDVPSGDCIPKKGLDRGVGATCSSNDECNSGTCLTSYPGGYCTSACGTQFQACEPGSECYSFQGGAANCYFMCQDNSNCRAGYRCEQVASGDSGNRSYCVPRCDANSCPDGKSCDAASGACVDGVISAQPVGTFCARNADCQSGQCDTTQPNGYCTSGCNGCAGPCVDGKCRASCQSEGDCRFGYMCEEGACLAMCRSDADCQGEMVCNTASGRCREKSTSSTVEDFFTTTFTNSASGSQEISFRIPDNALSAVVYLSDNKSELMAPWKIYAPDGTLLFDISNPSASRFSVLPSEGTFSMMLPPGPVFSFVGGLYKASFLRESGTAQTSLRVFGKTGSSLPDRQRLDLVFTFVGAPEGLTAATAKTDTAFQAGIKTFRELYEKMGIELGDITYEDLSGSDASAFRVIDTVSGANNELGRLFSKSKSLGQGINFFFVQEILGGDVGYIILGISGGIPGPPGIQGTVHSGVALTMADFRKRPTVFGQTMAHEGGHYLGLFHTTESGGNTHDPLPDTLECPASNDSNFDGKLSSTECRGKGAENFMFWLAGESANQVSTEQGRVLRRNPATR